MIYDATVIITEKLVIYPGDPQFNIKRIQSLPIDSLNVSTIEMGLHTGTHVDTPLHCFVNGKSITDYPIDRFQGTCQLIDAMHIPFGHGIKRRDLVGYSFSEGEIVLFKTQNSEIPLSKFNEEYIYLDSTGADLLIENNIKAVGIDYLSIDKYDSLTVHHKLLSNDILIYETLLLSHIPAGKYYFYGGPLKIKNSEGAPARVILSDFHLSSGDTLEDNSLD